MEGASLGREKEDERLCLGVGEKVKRKWKGRKVTFAHRKLIWWLGVNELGKGREEGVNN
jgi:hypothetical protein